jgi:spore maturation protein SpmB
MISFIDVSTWHNLMKGFRGFPLSIIHLFYRQRVLVDFSIVHAATILHWVIVVTREAFSNLGVLPRLFAHLLAQLVSYN